MDNLRINSPQPAQSYQPPRVGLPPEDKAAAADKAPLVTTVKKELEQAAKAETPKEQAKAQASSKELKRLADVVQRRLGGPDSQIQFSVDDTTGQPVVKVTDKTTHEVIRQIPSEEMLQIAKSLDRYKEGLLVNSQA